VNSSTSFHTILTEAPILLLVLTVLYFPKIKYGSIKFILPVVPILILYIFFDVFYSYLNRSPRFSDIQNLYSVFDFYPMMGIGIIASFLLIPLLISILFYYDFKRNSSIKTTILRVFILSLGIIFFVSNIFINIQKVTFKHIRYSQVQTIKTNGRISSFLFYSNMEKENRIKLLNQNFSKIDIKKTLYSDSLYYSPNIHFIVLESFINPNLVLNSSFSSDPIANELKPYLLNNDSFSKAISPVYGGRTAQAEFELLTGIKAFGKLNSIEFNVMNGNIIDGFISQLLDNNYNTKAMIATNSNGFNSKLAYKSLAFEKTEFLEESDSFIKINSKEKIFDGTVFDYNLKMLKRYFRNNRKPIFNYILGIYGHIPYELDESKRPKFIKVNNPKSEELERITNQFYYRTKALGVYINKLLKIDPNSIIYITSDHLPSIIDDNIAYKFDRYSNISLLINKGKTINFSEKKYFEIPWLIWDLLTKNKSRKNIDAKKMESLYFSALAQSL